jgi:hypothetical protein
MVIDERLPSGYYSFILSSRGTLGANEGLPYLFSSPHMGGADERH